MWESSNLKDALFNSYLLAPTVSIITLIFSIPTAYVFGRYNFVGKEIAKLLCILPLVTPYFVLSVFFTATSFRSGNAIRDKPERIWLKQQSGPATDGNYGETNSPKAVGQIEKTINEDNRY